jgi:hypothetical protein
LTESRAAIAELNGKPKRRWKKGLEFDPEYPGYTPCSGSSRGLAAMPSRPTPISKNRSRSIRISEQLTAYADRLADAGYIKEALRSSKERTRKIPSTRHRRRRAVIWALDQWRRYGRYCLGQDVAACCGCAALGRDFASQRHYREPRTRMPK